MKKFLTWVCLGALLIAVLAGGFAMGTFTRTYDGSKATVPVAKLQQAPDSYDDSTADGAAAAIVQQNLAKTHAVNDVTSIVFDFRGYDTMGEAFILITAVAGVTVLLRKTAAEKEEDRKHGQN
ncbi:MAG: hypothetical protein IJ179_04240 [Oscillospiraceae bacterium]|nr:hypothetical protein [Oscillospiraceae bacterium]